ncbi:hypothetical protein [Pajaroellobacter abortibovis]|uniref:Uncharacterized protein n=1 Tax=Pajaroellobacter abortibovis TaxID=1882918 RepID=A0A1L6MYI1_9BACT|nr:hypothetical protein [Pajaroellobacter abortibovis]APS00465.1 hypothetical protein BCY86_07090 [Pajaroellobacter abortibovis]
MLHALLRQEMLNPPSPLQNTKPKPSYLSAKYGFINFQSKLTVVGPEEKTKRNRTLFANDMYGDVILKFNLDSIRKLERLTHPEIS